MSEFYCDREFEMATAIRTWNYDPEIMEHAETCPICSEVLLVTNILGVEMQLANHEFASLPDAGLVWRKAQAKVREDATIKATWPIQLARVCAVVVGVFSVLWLIFELHALPHRTANLGLNTIVTSSVFGFTNLACMIGTLICIALSSWYMLREE